MQLVLSLVALVSVAHGSTPSPTVYDPSVGTANAPTLPAGANNGSATGFCLNSEDYSLWTATDDSANPSGYDKFLLDAEECATHCSTYLVTTDSSEDYNCGGFLQPACEGNLFVRCTTDCFRGVAPQDDADVLQAGYSANCSMCMGELANCGATLCTNECVLGSSQVEGCQKCNEEKCNPAFQECAGLNAQIGHPPPVDLIPVIAGAVGGFAVLLLVAILGAYYHYKVVVPRKKMMNQDDLARLAAAQKSPVVSHSTMSSPLVASNASVKKVSVAAPSMRMTSMASMAIANPDQYQAMTALVAQYDFKGEREDELHVELGTRLFGIEQQDGWWLAKTEKGVVGLIPANYCEVDTSGVPMEGSKRFVNPDF